MLQTDRIKNLAVEVGFDLCGVAQCRPFEKNAQWFCEWLAQGRNATLAYLERNLDKRFDPRLLVEGACTAVVCAVSYKNNSSEGYPHDSRTKIASYATATDYHTSIREMLQQMLRTLKAESSTLGGRAFVDTAPLLEKQLAVEAGLGWIGRQSLLITPRYGSFVVLGELLLTDVADSYDAPFEGSRCGRCQNCIDSCPTGAIVAPRVVDASRCIACHTIEQQPKNQIDLDGWIFGCDRCQSCCPYGQKAPNHTNPRFDPLFDPLVLDTQAWREMSNEEFDSRFSATPLIRSGLERIKGSIE